MTKKDSAITIELPASKDSCGALVANILQSVPDEIKHHVATNMVLDWQRSGDLSTALAANARELCRTILAEHKDLIGDLVKDWLDGAIDSIKDGMADDLRAKLVEKTEDRIEAVAQAAIMSAKQDIGVKTAQINEQAARDYRGAVQEQLGSTVKRDAEQILEDHFSDNQ